MRLFAIFLAASISGQLEVYAKQSCRNSLEFQKIKRIPESVSELTSVYRFLRTRHMEQKLKNPKAEYHFKAGEVFGETTLKMQRRLKARLKILEKSRVSGKHRKLASAVVQLADETIRDEFHYDDVFMLSHWYSIVMSIPFGSANKHRDVSKYVLSNISAQDVRLRSGYDFFFRNHPWFGYYLPQHGESSKLDLIKRRNQFLYTIGLVEVYTMADGTLMSPYRYWDHDQSSHGRSVNADAAFLRMHEIETEADLMTEVLRRSTGLEFVMAILDNRRISSDMKGFYLENLFQLDHERDTSVFIEEVYVKLLMAYFLSRTRSTVHGLGDVFSNLKFSYGYLRMPITGQELKDFKILYLRFPQFRDYWDELKRQTGSDRRFQRMERFENGRSF